LNAARAALAMMFLVLALAPGPARGDPASQPAASAKSRGQKLLDRGLTHYRARRYHEAVKTLKKAVAAATEPTLLGRIHVQLGVNYFVTNKLDEAVSAFTRALEYDPGLKLDIKEVGGTVFNLFEKTRQKFRGLLVANVAGNARPGLAVHVDGVNKGAAPWKGSLTIGRHRVRLETGDRRWACEVEAVVGKDTTVTVSCEPVLQTGVLSVTSTPGGARVLLGGQQLGRTPLLGVRVAVGAHDLVVRLAGRKTQRRRVTIRLDGEVKISLALKKKKPGPRPRNDGLLLRQAKAERKSKTTWAYVSLGGGLALAAGAAVLYGVGLSQGGRAHDDYMAAFGAGEMDAHYADVEAARTKLYVGHALAGAAAVAVGVSIYLLLTRPDAVKARAGKRSAAHSLGLTPGQGGLNLWLGGTF